MLKSQKKGKLMEKADTRARLEGQATSRREELHRGSIISFVEEHVLYGNDSAKTFDLVMHPGAVAMVPIDREGKIVLVRQWRRAAGQILLELPAGTLESGEDPLQCAGRELQEEIGCEAKKITPLGGFFTAPGFCNEYIHLYLAEELHPNPIVGDDFDEIDVLRFTLSEITSQIDRGEIIDAKTIAGIYRYDRTLRT